MYDILQILTVIFVAVAMTLSLAHALELPGKMRLDKKTYYAMQSIYYPGFTIGGVIGEGGGFLLTLILLFLTPFRSEDFWLILIALFGLIAMQAVYWLVTHPVNNFWVAGENLDRFSAGFFSFGVKQSRQAHNTEPPDWTELRNRWEYSHVIRAIFSAVSFIMLIFTVS